MEIVNTEILSKKEWFTLPSLKHWVGRDSTIKPGRGCGCKGQGNYLVLEEHDSCIRGRIDTTICTICDVAVKSDIIR